MSNSSLSDAKKRIEAFTATAAMPKKKAKKSAKKVDKAPKKTAKDPKAFHDKMDAKLEKLAKRYKVSIKLHRNKTKQSNIVVGKLRNRPFGEVAKLFKEISHTSPVPQKINENGASFRVFGPRITASNPLFDFETIKAHCDQDVEFRKKIKQLIADESYENENLDSVGSGGAEDDEDNEEIDDSEDTTDTDVEELMDYVEANGITQGTLNTLLDSAAKDYVEGLKNPDNMEDLMFFVYSVMGYDDLKTALSTQANKSAITASIQSKKLLAPMRR